MSTDFKWLEEEISPVRTGKFFRTYAPVAPGILAEFESRFGLLPDDYKSFLLHFGQTKLFRIPDRNEYEMIIYGIPQVSNREGSDQFVRIGLRDGNVVYL